MSLSNSPIIHNTSDMEDFIPSDTSFSISSDLSQKSQMCAAVTVNYDNQLEGDEDFSVCLSDIPPANCVIVEGGESVDITIEDNEGSLSLERHICYFVYNYYCTDGLYT